MRTVVLSSLGSKTTGSSPQRRLASARVKHSCITWVTSCSSRRSRTYVYVEAAGQHVLCRCTTSLSHVPRSRTHCETPLSFGSPINARQYDQGQNQGHGVANAAFTASIGDLLKGSIDAICIDARSGWQVGPSLRHV
jgi:hypothetical protein